MSGYNRKCCLTLGKHKLSKTCCPSDLLQQLSSVIPRCYRPTPAERYAAALAYGALCDYRLSPKVCRKRTSIVVGFYLTSPHPLFLFF